MKQLKLTDDVMVQLLLAGVKDAAMEAAASAANYKTPNELFQFLKVCDDNRKRHQENAIIPRPERTDLRHVGKTMPPGKSIVTCYFCGQKGYKSNECLKKKKSVREVLTAQSKVNTSRKYFVQGKIGNVKINSYVDFGSSVMLMTEKTAAELKLKWSGNSECLRRYCREADAIDLSMPCP